MFKEAFKAFLEMKEHEAVLSAEGAKKMGILATGRVLYAVLDYLIAAGLGVMVVWMNIRGFSYTNIFLATWLYDFVAAAGFYLLSDMSGCDITLGRSLRRSADVMFRNGVGGRILGGLLLLGVSVKAIVWEGPEVICFLFKKEIGSSALLLISLVVLSAGQGVFGAWLYTTGYKVWALIF
jgi:hypothetical protein